MPRPSSATESRSPIDRTADAADRDAARLGVTQRVGQRLLRDADDLALDAVAGARQFLDEHVDRHAGRALAEIGEPLDRGRDVLARSRRSAAACRPSVALRPGASAPVRSRSRAGGGAVGVSDVQLAARSLELHQDGGEALREIVVDVARETVALFEDRLAALFGAAALDDAAVMQRERRLPRDRFDQLHAPPVVISVSAPRARRPSSSRASRRRAAAASRSSARARVRRPNARSGSGSRGSSPPYSTVWRQPSCSRRDDRASVAGKAALRAQAVRSRVRGR